MEIIWLLFPILLLMTSQVSSNLQLYPAELISPTIGSHSFICLLGPTDRDSISDVKWRVNGSLLEELTLVNVTEDFVALGGGLAALTFTNPPASYNGTRIQCMAFAEIRSMLVSSNFAQLIVLDDHSLITGLMISEVGDDSLSLNWNSSNANPDVTYCVEVNITRDPHSFSQVNSPESPISRELCSLRETEFVYSLQDKPWCNRYIISVMSVNGIYNGTGNTRSYQQIVSRPAVIGNVTPDVQPLSTTHSAIKFSVNMSAPVCDAKVTIVDETTEETTTINRNDLSILGTMANVISFNFNSTKFVGHHEYNVSVTAENIAGPITSYAYAMVTIMLPEDATSTLPQVTKVQSIVGSVFAVFVISSLCATITWLLVIIWKRKRAKVRSTEHELLAEQSAEIELSCQADSITKGYGYPTHCTGEHFPGGKGEKCGRGEEAEIESNYKNKLD